VADFSPDIVAFTGDFISLRPDGTPPLEQLQRVLEHFPKGTEATLGALGNHDYGLRWSQPKVAAKITSIAANAGLRILRNETVQIDGLRITGVDEMLAGQCNDSAFHEKRSDAARLVLCHNPDAADTDIWNGYQGWILAGHTHGGQCKPPFFPPPLLPVKNTRYTAGEFDLFDGRTMYINRGLGHLMRVRFNVRPEVTVFRLVAA
jgi:uncharacterized protein